jgi:hypothetical protein
MDNGLDDRLRSGGGRRERPILQRPGPRRGMGPLHGGLCRRGRKARLRGRGGTAELPLHGEGPPFEELREHQRCRTECRELARALLAASRSTEELHEQREEDPLSAAHPD